MFLLILNADPYVHIYYAIYLYRDHPDYCDKEGLICIADHFYDESLLHLFPQSN
ncbi:hypothetical protein RhiirC2_738677 [Rhizophagus irregularis]|uniref:Uncharacterized protein n=1 Tax=Rhizophagus irregularis TaxID=588596 RepID=A0A2N1NL01_9GLOM|nr:hypothetical protein RhiirC2_738677 [Rhizophagus irregularis]